MQEVAEQAAKESGEEISEEDKAQLAELQEDLAEGSTEAYETASSAGNVAMLAGAQGILGLIGSIVAFIALGKGNKATIGGVLLLGAVVISLWAGIKFPSIGMSNILQLIAGIFAFVAAPQTAA